MPDFDDICVAGVDEAGRGPLAGPVIAAAVILSPDCEIVGIDDSKKLSAKKRERLFELISQDAIACSIGRADVQEIDELNILQATLLAMSRAVKGLSVRPSRVLVDGNQAPDIDEPVETLIRGDSLNKSIAAASILAKVTRDREMLEIDRVYPGYGFARHKGYPTKAHIEAIGRYGVLPVHRRSFAPVAREILRLALKGPHNLL
jgi:ribonuclease HII